MSERNASERRKAKAARQAAEVERRQALKLRPMAD